MTETDPGFEYRLQVLEQRLRLLEDHNEIMRLMYSYGPSVDSGLADVVGGLWIEDGVYDVDTGRMAGRCEIENMVRTHPHQGFIQQGCGHIMSPAHITVDGDAAVAVCHTQLILRRPDGSGYQVSRVTANRWELIRTKDGWRVTTRTSRILNGQEGSRAILASAFRQGDAVPR
ncbi:nuclear transport factor 2 family protein [Rhodococcus oryzae]|uniref:Nuclear transport factor 2 family protein n=1 Tax=Rhodococcus oryzae TaxID=2571143 RepID=A0ABY2RL18_9NOCA|nr:nuclear transport factor 2 family protein [Rhodococcus oryzae]TJZ78442.1 nuclear transport factor 2 family protein [Rhodococcus oryzae]